ncbi:PEP-CTERM sorting domain-containing protein [Azohydromonas caseinilytica]|uniref:PEP-CTERM sorting domain-containing protein n=1 Tax=Azohydromonas caseinilytica TaxID=2728836 RepID=A0A848FF14_9BURK|nr:PEP-CTERM sorting domain-containing protein [Azohydromonas caseinilytica]NML16491.1 PEP-CTERM sorting domain-containing protein [Azohydromonas caseinilytica]
MHFRLAGMVAAALALASGPAAWADVSVSARLSEFGYSLIDLDPSDGIDPALSFSSRNYTTLNVVREGPAQGRDNRMTGETIQKRGLYDPSSPIFRHLQMSQTGIDVGLYGSVTDHGFNTFLRAQARHSRTDPLFAGYFYTFSSPAFRFEMSLTPATQVVWTGVLAVSAQQTLGRRGKRVEDSIIGASLALTDMASGLGLDFTTLGINLLPGQVDTRSEVSAATLSFSNLGNAMANIRLTGEFNTEGQSFLPVPEPGTPLLMLCGLGLTVGVAVRRRCAVGSPAS